MFAHSYSKLSRTCYGESSPYALQKSSVLRWLQKQDDDDDEEKSRTAAGRECECRQNASFKPLMAIIDPSGVPVVMSMKLNKKPTCR